MKYAEMLNGYIPIFSQFGQDIYASDVVQQAISCLVTELTKVNPFHIRKMEVIQYLLKVAQFKDY